MHIYLTVISYQLSVISYQFEEEFSNSAILDSEGRNKEFSFLTPDS
jgi:hypothetical protein